MNDLISVFVPVYNEEEILEENVKRIIEELKKTKHNFEIFIVDDTSTDNTPQIGQKLSQNNSKINYLRFNNGPSRRENLAASFKQANGNIVLFMDIDLATNLEHLPQLINEMKRGAAIATGSRYMGIIAKRELFRKIISKVYNLFLRLIFNSRIKDHQCGFKAFKKNIILNLINEMGYDKNFSRGWFWDAEMLIRAQKKGLKIKEFPIKWNRGEQSSFNLFREAKLIPFAFNLKKGLKKIMKIGIVGGGIIGLMCGYLLSKKHRVTIFEKDQLGGLASSFKLNNTYLEKYYHHFFTSDQDLINLLKELDLQKKVIFKKSTMAFFDKKIYPFTTTADLLKFKPLKLFERLKLGLMIFYLSTIKKWEAMDKISVEKWVSRNVSRTVYDLVWQPLLKSKFGSNQKNISAAWLWGRIYPRYHSRKIGREQLGYIKGSFRELFLKLESAIKAKKGNFIKTTAKNIAPTTDQKIKITTDDNSNYIFDKVIFTPSLPIFIETTKGLPVDYTNKLRQVKYQSIVCLCLKLKKKISDIYWLNISDPKIKISGLVGHTNLINREMYNADILYAFQYLSPSDNNFQRSESGLLKLYCQEIKKIFPEFNESLVESFHLAKDQYATPIFTTNYSTQIPSFTTPIDNLYLVTMAQIYPFDRNINNSIKLAKKICKII